MRQAGYFAGYGRCNSLFRRRLGRRLKDIRGVLRVNLNNLRSNTQSKQMHLAGPDGQSLELRIVGYQFPHLESEEYDSNWLIVEGKVVHPRGEWTFRSPCLLTYEVASLADWLDSVVRGRPRSEKKGFIEPNLRVQFVESFFFGARLRVYFEAESRPSWAAGEDDLWVELSASDFDLRRAAASLRGQLERYPQRAAR